MCIFTYLDLLFCKNTRVLLFTKKKFFLNNSLRFIRYIYKQWANSICSFTAHRRGHDTCVIFGRQDLFLTP